MTNDIDHYSLPSTLPVFPLYDVMLPPGGVVALRIFEPRYIRLVNYALQHGRYIAIAQKHDDVEDTPIYNVAGMGRITHFEEHHNGEYEVTLLGMQRVVLSDEVIDTSDEPHKFKIFNSDYSPYGQDNHGDDNEFLDKESLFTMLATLFANDNLSVNWDILYNLSDKRILALILIAIPLSAAEKQAILEAKTYQDMAQSLHTLVKMALLEDDDINANVTKN